MSRIFITGSADGLGQLAAKALIAKGHNVLLHARNEERGRDAIRNAPGADGVVIADLNNVDETIGLSEQVNALGTFDAVIHNAALYRAPGEDLLRVNTLAPYILTCLINRPKRLTYLSSSMHYHAGGKLDNFKSNPNSISYSDTKLHMVMLCKVVARRWTDVYANVLNPGWVPTKMGGAGAPDSLQSGYETQVWLASSDDQKVKVSGRYFHHKKEADYNRRADDELLQERFMTLCEEVTGVAFPDNR